jgi:hypothetical protein
LADNFADLVISLKADFGDVAKQLGDVGKGVENLGKSTEDVADQMKALAASTGLTGGQLHLLETVLLADSKAGIDLAESLKSVSESGGSLGKDVAEAAEKLLETLPPAADAAKDLGDALKGVGDKAPAAASEGKGFNESTKETAESAHHAAEGAGELLSELMKFAGIAMSAAALREFGMACLELYSEVENVSVMLTFMTKDAKGTEEAIEGLKATALKFALPLDPLLVFQQRMTEVGISSKLTREAIVAAADGAAVAHRSFEAASEMMRRMAQSGMVMPRALQQIGLSSRDLAKVMGVTADEVTSQFKSMTETARIEILIEAMEKWKGAGEALANTTSGQLTRLKTEWKFTMEEIGGAVAPTVKDSLPGFSQALKMVTGAAVLVITGLKEVISLVIGIGMTTTSVFKTIGDIYAAAFTGGPKAAAAAAAAGMEQIKASGKFTWESLVKDAQEGSDLLSKIFHKPVEDEKGNDAGRERAAKEMTDKEIALAELRIDIETAHQKAFLTLERMGYQEQEKLGLISAAANLARLQNVAGRELALEEDSIRKKADLDALRSKNSVMAMAKRDGELQKARDKALIEDLKETEKVEAAKERIFDQNVKAHIQALNAALSFEQRIAAHVADLNKKLGADREKASVAGEEGARAHMVRMEELRKQQADFEFSIGNISAAERIRVDMDIDAKEIAIQRASIAREMALLDARSRNDTDYASRHQALLNKLQAMEDKYTLDRQKNEEKLQRITIADDERRLQLEIQEAELRGRDSRAFVMQLAAVQAKMEQMREQSHGWSTMWVESINNIGKAFGHLQTGLVDIIMRAKGFGQAFKDVAKGIATDVLNTIIGSALKKLSVAITNLIFDWLGFGLAAKGANVATVMSDAAVAAAATFASISAIPIIGPAMAPEWAAASYAAVAAMAPLAMLEKGGELKEETFALLHPQEMVLPAEIAQGLRSAIRGGQGQLAPGAAPAAAMTTSININGPIYGVPSRDFLKQIFTAQVREMRLAGVHV